MFAEAKNEVDGATTDSKVFKRNTESAGTLVQVQHMV